MPHCLHLTLATWALAAMSFAIGKVMISSAIRDFVSYQNVNLGFWPCIRIALYSRPLPASLAVFALCAADNVGYLPSGVRTPIHASRVCW